MTGSLRLVGGYLIAVALCACVHSATAQALTFSRQARLIAPDGYELQKFGRAVAIEGDVAAVTAFEDSEIDTRTGALYVFERAGGIWSFSAKLFASDASVDDRLGWDVTIDNGVIVVGPQHPAGFISGQESVYVFEKVGGQWQETAAITPDDNIRSDLFGRNVVLVGDTLVVSASRKDQRLGQEHGVLYVFQRQGRDWVEVQQLTAPPGTSNDCCMGNWVSFDGQFIVADASYAPFGTAVGSFHVWRRDGPGFLHDDWIVPEPGGGVNRFYDFSTVSGSWLAVTSGRNDSTDPNRVQIYRRQGGAWNHFQTLAPSVATPNDRFGQTLHMENNLLMAGTSGFDFDDRGAVFLYELCGRWVEREIVEGDLDEGANRFGERLDLEGDGFIVGYEFGREGGLAVGVAEIFEWSPSVGGEPPEVSPPGSDPLRVSKAGSQILLSFEDLGAQAATYNVYRGDLASFYSHTDLLCQVLPPILDGRPTQSIDDSNPASYYLVTAVDACEGSSGTASDRNQRPEELLVCDP